SCKFFFFSSRRRHTRCLSDWSSDVCSSDLAHLGLGFALFAAARDSEALAEFRLAGRTPPSVLAQLHRMRELRSALQQLIAKRTRSEERRVGKECRAEWGRAPERQSRRRSEV